MVQRLYLVLVGRLMAVGGLILSEADLIFGSSYAGSIQLNEVRGYRLPARHDYMPQRLRSFDSSIILHDTSSLSMADSAWPAFLCDIMPEK